MSGLERLITIRTLGALIGAVLGIATLAGCGTYTASQGAAATTLPSPTLPNPTSPPTSTAIAARPEPPLGPIVQVVSNTRISLPLDPYMTSLSDINVVGKAKDMGAAACMRALGFKLWTADTVQSSRPGDENEVEFAEYLDPATAARSGYPRAQTAEALNEGANRPPSRHSPTEEEMRIYEGTVPRTKQGRPVAQGGCFGEAERRIFGGVSELPASPRDLAIAAKSFTLNDSRFRKNTSEWSSCMAQRGVNYPSPFMAARDERWLSRNAQTPASEVEKRVAGADAACQREVNHVGVYKAVQAAYQTRLLAENKGKLEAALPIFRTWVANAKGVIARGGD